MSTTIPASTGALSSSRTFLHWTSILLFVGGSIGFIAPLVWYNFWPVGHGLDAVGHQLGRDFLNTWAGPQIAFRGDSGILYDFWKYDGAARALFGPQLLANYNFSYPPSALALFWPLGSLPYFPALALWTIATFAALAWVMLWEVPRQEKYLAIGLLLVAPASLINIMSGQNGFLSGALLLGGMLLLDRRPILAGVLLGLLTYKPHLGLVVAFVLLVLRCWRTIAAAAVTASSMIVVSVALFGIEPWLQYFSVTRRFQVQLLIDWQGLYAFMMPTWLGFMRSNGVPFEAAMAVQSAIGVAVVAASCWAVTLTRDAAQRAFIVATATPLALPYAFNYDLPAMSACIVWIVAGRLAVTPQWRIVVLLGWVAAVINTNYGLQPLGVAPAAITALFALAVSIAIREASPAGGPERSAGQAAALHAAHS